MTSFEKEDILHFTMTNEPEVRSLEINPNITPELNETGELIRIEIINSSAFIRYSILESVQGRLLTVKN
ncbi:MAG: DUF2283 domain-containing protein [Microcoleaceae cyanobacterium MO_207.B10]|nr:DUF2283 domain-containing protein [Microcoleaceae cyanobacterium MO_207.B10]